MVGVTVLPPFSCAALESSAFLSIVYCAQRMNSSFNDEVLQLQRSAFSLLSTKKAPNIKLGAFFLFFYRFNTLFVNVPGLPSAIKPFLRWKFFSALSVAFPKMLSAVNLYPRLFNVRCNERTSVPLSPTFNTLDDVNLTFGFPDAFSTCGFGFTVGWLYAFT